MRAYELKLKDGKNEITVGLRLPFKALFDLKKKYKEETIATIMSSIVDLEKMCDVFTMALNYDGNSNIVKEGSALYDLLVDNEYAGQGDFAKVLTSVAVYSGIIKPSVKEKIDRYADENTTEAFNAIFDNDEKNPTTFEQ